MKLVPLVCYLLLSPVWGFVVPKNIRTTTLLCAEQQQASWSDYKHEFIDPEKLQGRKDPSKRHLADELWLGQFERDKEILQNMNQAASATPETSDPPLPPVWSPSGRKYINPIIQEKKTVTTWDQYKHNFIDPLVVNQHDEAPSSANDPMDPRKQAVAHMYWLMHAEEEKEKLHSMATSDTHVPGTWGSASTWDHYQDDYIDPLTPGYAPALENHMDPRKRRSADQFWLKVFDEEKAKLHGSTSSSTETEIHHVVPTWDEYMHEHMDPAP